MKRNPLADTAVIIVVIIMLSMAIYVLTPHTEPEPGKTMATIIISTDFGATQILDKHVVPGVSVMQALENVSTVKTGYGGKFVVAINNITSNPQKNLAWFYYVNGFLAKVGATEYVIHPGDVIHWDFHYWGNAMFVSAETQDFPYMLTNGYNGQTRPTVVAYTAGFYKDARSIQKFLKNKNLNVTMKNVENLTDSEKKTDNLILVGKNASIFEVLYSNYQKLGLKYRVSGDTVVDWSGKTYTGDFVEATQSPFNPAGTTACENIVIIISGTGSLNDAVNALIGGNLTSFWYFEGAT